MNVDGLIVGAVSFVAIGLFHPLVIKGEYHFGVRIWPLFAALGAACLTASCLVANVCASSILAVVGFCSLWAIGELFKQRERVKKGWFPKKRAKDAASTSTCFLHLFSISTFAFALCLSAAAGTVQLSITCSNGDRVRVNGAEPVSTANVSVEAGASVELTPVPASGRTFLRWRGDVGAATALAPDGRLTLPVARASSVSPVTSEDAAAVTLSAFDYAQEGLVALWDGADNAGYGIHDASATTWKQLVAGSPDDDLRPNATLGSNYTWSDTALTITSTSSGAVFTNSACTLAACIEMNYKHGDKGFVLRAMTAKEVDHRIFGYWGMFYVTGRNDGKGFSWSFDSTAYHTFSADYTVFTTAEPYRFYADGESRTTYGNVTWQASGNSTWIGNWYQTPKPSFHTIRYYSTALSDADRAYNLAVDRVRFNGVSAASAFADLPSSPVAIVRASIDSPCGQPTPGYGVHAYRGTVGQTFSIDGFTQQADGVRAVVTDDGARILLHGYSLQVGDAAATEGTEPSVSVASLTGRTTLTWNLSEQKLLALTCTNGDAVRVNGSDPVSSTNLWVDVDTELTLTPVPASGRTFLRWRGDVGAATALAPDGRLTLPVSYASSVSLVTSEDAAAVTLSSFDYAQEGLVALWDGADNAGYGIHDASATTWKQLVAGSPHTDLLPSASMVSGYTWSDTALNVTTSTKGAVFTNSYGQVLAALETNLKFSDSGFVISAETTDNADQRLIGYWSQYYISGASGDYGFNGTYDTKSYRTLSADYTVHTSENPYRFYVDGVEYFKKNGVGYGGKNFRTAIGNWSGSYGLPKPSFRSIRYYGTALSDSMRAYNLSIDRIRFNGVSAETEFSSQPSAPVAIVRATTAVRCGKSTPSYGVHAYRGTVGQTFTLTGYEVLSDGSRSFSIDDGTRALLRGYSLQVGDAAATEGTEPSVSVASLTGRTTLTWNLSEQKLLALTCTNGDAVRVNGSDPVSSTNLWVDVGTELTLTPVPASGRRFRRWTGDIRNLVSRAPDGTIVAPMSAARTVALVTETDDGAAAFHAGDYAAEGLVALWDGTENAGADVHDPLATTWKQLIPGTVHHDLLPSAAMVGGYSWSAQSLDITTETLTTFTNDCCESLGTIEANVKYTYEGWILSAYSPEDTTHRLLGFINGQSYIRGNNGTSTFSYKPGYTAYHTYSTDYTNFKLYADNAEPATYGTASCGASGSRTWIGSAYRSARPSFRSIRYYKPVLSKPLRDLNYAIDQVRFEGVEPADAFDDLPDAPVVLVLALPARFGTAYPAYGAHTVQGVVTQTFTLAGTRLYDDGVTAIPGKDDPEGSRAKLNGSSLQCGDGTTVRCEGASVTVADITNRTTLVWLFESQNRLKVSANAGGSVAIAGHSETEVWYDSADATEVALTATPAAGYLFSTWVGDTDGIADVRSATVTVTMGQAHRLEARFVRERNLSSRSYATNGLAAHWDGRENAGRGLHSATTDRWVELAQGRSSGYAGNGSFIWKEDGLLLQRTPTMTRVEFYANPWMYQLARSVAAGGGMTWEVPYTFSSSGNGYLIYTGDAQIGVQMRFANNLDVKRARIFGTYLTSNVNGEIYYGWSDSTVDSQGTATLLASNLVGRYYQNGVHASACDKTFSGTLVAENQYNYVFAGQGQTGTVHGVRIYSRALTEHEILWNNAVDRVRYFRGFGETNELLHVITPYGASEPTAGTRVRSAAIDVDFSIAEALYDYEDGARAVWRSATRRARYDGWELSEAGPDPRITQGQVESFSLTMTNLATTVEWKMTPQSHLSATVANAADGRPHGAVVVSSPSGVPTISWVDDGTQLNFTALPDAGWRACLWTTNGIAIQPHRNRYFSMPMNAPLEITVAFEPAKGTMLIVR